MLEKLICLLTWHKAPELIPELGALPTWCCPRCGAVVVRSQYENWTDNPEDKP